MKTNDIIIIILSVLLALLILWNYNTQSVATNTSTTEQFTTNFDNDENIIGNILDFANPDTGLYNKLFKKTYRLTGFYVEGPAKYSVKVNGSFVSHNESIELVKGKYYDITDLNVKSKAIEFSSKDSNNITKVIVYGFNTINTKSADIYNKSSLLVDNVVNAETGTIKLKGGVDCLVDYLELPDVEVVGDENISIEYKNKFNPVALKYKSGIANFLDKFHVKSSKIYFDTPLLATELKFNIDPTVLDKVVIYGKVATDSDINSFRLESEIANSDNDLVSEGGKCPPMKDIINKQKLINELCNSMSEKDKIRNQQTYYEKTKKYIGKLKQQDSQITALKAQIESLQKDSANSSLSIQEKIASAKSIMEEINTSNPFNKVAINYDESATTTTLPPTTTTQGATTTTQA